MRKIVLALLLFSGLAAAAQAAQWTDGPPPVRFSGLQNLFAPPAGATYSLGGYAPADPNTDPNMDPNANPGLIDKGEYASPPGVGCGCGQGGCSLWDGYQARPCYHRHHWGTGCGHKRWGGGACGGGGGGCGGGGCGCGGGGYGGGYGLGGYGYTGGYGGGYGAGCGGGCGCASPCCAPVCRQRHHCHLFHKRSNCCNDVATTCDSCGCGATDATQSTPSDDNAPRPTPELLEPAPAAPTPAPAPGPSAGRQPRGWRSLTAMGGTFEN